MKKVPMPEIKALLIDWTLDLIPSNDGVIVTFLALPWAPGGEPQSAAPIAPMGLNQDSVRRLHADLGELLRTMESGSPGNEMPSSSSPKH